MTEMPPAAPRLAAAPEPCAAHGAPGSGVSVKRRGGWPKGKPCSPETRAKMSAAKRGKKRSAETRAKISAGQLRRHYPDGDREERIAEMVLLRDGGATVPEIAARFGVRTQRVYQLLATVAPRAKRQETDWTDGMDWLLRWLWDDGRTAKEIAEHLGISRNAVIGRAHRINLAARPSPIIRTRSTQQHQDINHHD